MPKYADPAVYPVTAPAADDTAMARTNAGGDRNFLLGNLAGLAPLVIANDQAPYFAAGAWGSYSLTAAGRAIAGAADAPAQRVALSLGSAAVVNVGNNNVGLLPVLSTQNNNNVSLLIQGTTSWASFEGQGNNADGNDVVQMTVVARGTAVVANATEKRIAFFGLTAVGPTAGNRGGGFYLATKMDGSNTLTRRLYIDYIGHLQPGVTDAQDIGQPSMRYRQIYAQNATISTSDARLKTEPRQLRDAEFKAASAIARLPAVWRWIHRVEGDETCEPEGRDARKHFGPTVQAAIALMEAHGLDPFAYSFICYDEWEAEDATYDEDGNETTPARAAGDRYSFRKEELLCFLVAAMARQHDELEERVVALEAKLTP